MTARSKSQESNAADLDAAIDRFAPDVAGTARAALAKLRARFPGARELVYERRGSLPIGLAPADQGSAVFSVVLYKRWVRFFFLEGATLDDPHRRLEGDGTQVRSIRLDERAAILDDPYIRGLIGQAQKDAGVNLRVGRRQIVFKSRIQMTNGGQPVRE